MLGYNALCCKAPGRFGRGDGLSMGYFSKTTNVGNHTSYKADVPLHNFSNHNSPV